MFKLNDLPRLKSVHSPLPDRMVGSEGCREVAIGEKKLPFLDSILIFIVAFHLSLDKQINNHAISFSI
jgi:hypothetical protein